MIDLDLLEDGLNSALTDELRGRQVPAAPTVLPPAPDPVPAPVASRCRRPASKEKEAASRPRLAPTPPPPVDPAPPASCQMVWDELDIEQHCRAIPELISQAQLAEADLHLAAHADLARAAGTHRGDVVGWEVMRVLLSGRQAAACRGIEELQALDPAGRDPVASDRYWTLRFAVALTWGGEDERYDVLDHCRERAYCHGDRAWQGRLTLLLARMGRTSEAGLDFDATISSVQTTSIKDAAWLDLVTDLAEAAAVLGDPARSALVRKALGRVSTPPVVVVGPAWVCKGAAARFQALALAATEAVDQSDKHFRAAAERHRRLGADVLLARTLDEWGHSLIGPDPARSAQLLRDAAGLSRRLGLAHDHHVADEVSAKAS